MSDSLQLSRSEGPITNTTLAYWSVSFEDLSKTLSTHETGKKNGSYFVRGPADKREDDALKEAYVAILDGDSRIDIETGEVTKGAPDPILVAEVLTDADIKHLIYSSHSHDKGNNRYRVVVPVFLRDEVELQAVVDWLIDLLHRNSVPLAPVTENYTWAQAWYLPRVDADRADLFYFSQHDTDEELDVPSILDWWKAKQQKEEKQSVESGSSVDDPNSPIGKFNTEQGTTEYLDELLTEAGYILKYSGRMNDAPCYRYLGPASTTGTPGCVLFKSKAGKWRVCSHHGEGDPLGQQKDGKALAHDAFDVFRILKHGGDERAALHAIGVAVKYSREELEEMIEEADADDLDRFIEINRFIGTSDLASIEIGALHKAIKKKAKINISDLKADNQGVVAEEKIDERELAALVISLIGKENLLYAEEWFYLWTQQGVWQRHCDRQIKQWIHYACKQQRTSYTSKLVDAVTNLIKTDSFRVNHQFNQDSGTINVQNGELLFDSQTGTWMLYAHYREHYRTTQLPVMYDPAATAPRFQEFLNEIFAGEPDAGQKKVMVLELIGYTLLTTCRYEKFALLIGSGANGKSVLLGVLEALLGRDNICAVQPSRFDNAFNRAHLHGKLANIITEIAEGAEIADAQLKAIVSGELTTAEHKHKHPFDFHPFSTCWFGTNHMPHTRDFSDALFRRAIVLTFPHKFEGPRCDPYLKEKLIQELPGLLNLALAAIAGVFVRGEFTTCKSNEEAKKLWRLEADQVAQFIEECCVAQAGGICESRDLYNVYKRWAEDAGIKRNLNKKNFGSRLDRLGFSAGKGAGGIRIRSGLRISNY